MAATASPSIQVYALFPRVVALDADLDVDPANWCWIHCLTFPIMTLNLLQFSRRPYKWIRYAIGVVLGAEGDLSSSEDFLNVVDYDAGLPDEHTVLYYHTSDAERRRMFPVDPAISCIDTTSSATTRRIRFLDDVAERDERVCVLTGMDKKYCQAVHLLAHDKGNMYISTYTQRCSRDPTRNDLIQDIDSVRNGLLLNIMAHRSFECANEKTPNFAMTTADIDPAAPLTEKRWTAHAFRPDEPPMFTFPPGSPLNISDTPEYPPAILFDAVYASAVLHHFGTQTLKNEASAAWKDTYYYPGLTNDVTKAEVECKARREFHHWHGPDMLDMLMVLPYILVPQNERQAIFREAKERAEAARRCAGGEVNLLLKKKKSKS